LHQSQKVHGWYSGVRTPSLTPLPPQIPALCDGYADGDDPYVCRCALQCRMHSQTWPLCKDGTQCPQLSLGRSHFWTLRPRLQASTALMYGYISGQSLSLVMKPRLLGACGAYEVLSVVELTCLRGTRPHILSLKHEPCMLVLRER
jgi:hypothetical protein